ncbi:hypothetical protein ACGFNP_33585 [Nonomuraea sp. NPDC049269]|uniref:hypothetical protein n=1 Tax=Nonomuraea sp. NPDC049269 TaxID=3364349 RepID=UPI003720D3FC
MHQAAARELREELGHVIAPSALGPVVAISSGTWALGGETFSSVDSYFFLRVSGLEVDTSGMDDEERRVTDRFEWWTVSQLSRSRCRGICQVRVRRQRLKERDLPSLTVLPQLAAEHARDAGLAGTRRAGAAADEAPKKVSPPYSPAQLGRLRG